MIRGTVVIIGRPNVGKSTLFNNLTRTHTAITDDQPGVTRDRIYGTAYYDSSHEDGFAIVDTGGFESKDYRFQPFKDDVVWEQSLQAVRHADLLIFMVDGKDGLHPLDDVIYRELQKERKPLLVVINKVDGPEHEAKTWDFLKLGIDEPIALGAKAGYNLKLLLEHIRSKLEESHAPKVGHQEANVTKIALIGKPNVGKSSLLNRLTGEQRALVSEIAGTTRDSISSRVVYHNHTFEFIDTAGLRRKSKVIEQIESYSTVRSLANLQQADLCLLLIDAKDGFSDQDAKILGLAIKKSIPSLIIVNKWDLVENKTSGSAKAYATSIYDQIGDMAYVPILFVSCLENQRIPRILEYCLKLSQTSGVRISTSQVNATLEKIVAEHSPQIVKRINKRIKFYYATQIGIKPPTFIIKTNVPKDLTDSYKRFMMKRFKSYLGFEEIPIIIKYRPKNDTDPKK